MKKIISTILFVIGFTSLLYCADPVFQIRVITSQEGYLQVEMRETTGNLVPTTSDLVTDIVFQIKWLQSLGNVDLGSVLCTDYQIAKSGTRSSKGSYYYQEFYANNTPFNFPFNWTVNVWQKIMTIGVTSGSGVGTFEVGDANFVGTGVNIGINLTDYTPNVNGSASNYSFPTTIYDYYWTGSVSTDWNTAGNWYGTCQTGVKSVPPTSSNNCFIPGNISNFPSGSWGASAVCNALRIGSDAQVSVPSGKSVTSSGAIKVVESASRAAGQLIINPGGWVTAGGSTTIGAASQLQILATSAGIGSFIDNGTINYGASGSASIQTYLSNSGTYYYHQVGPTVDNLPSASGVPLSDFNIVSNNTFAYEWDEPTQAWLNKYTLSYPVNTGKGMLLTTNNGSSGTYTQVGSIINTNVTLNLVLSGDPTPESSTYGWNLKSNPYSAALDWDKVWTREDPLLSSPNDLNPITYILNNGSSTYASYNASTNVGTGMTKDVQVGQGFWVQYLTNPYSSPASINITLQPGDRNHSTAAFLKSDPVNQLTLTSNGNNSQDVLAIAFRDNGTFNYDPFIDVDKWDSYWEDASEFWTVSADQRRLTQNILPELGNNDVSVPLTFKFGSTGAHTITASDIESFEGNVEIFLEDLVTGGEWQDLVQNPVYSFESPEVGAVDRFVVHFFGTTGLNDHDAARLIKIYGYGRDAYIVNRGTETVKEYVAYDMMGRELHRGTLPNKTVNKVTIGDASAYYIVKVITREGRIYTDKVYITK